ncbi:MAG: AMP phosphorylase [Nanoarchaeota archaeon]
MKLKVKDMDISTGGVHVAILHQDDAALLDLHPLDRVKIKNGKRIDTVVLDIGTSSKLVAKGTIGIFDEVMETLNLSDNKYITITPARKPLSLEFIKKKLDGFKLNKTEIEQIVWDVVHNKLSDIELTYFVAACYAHELDIVETIILTKAMAGHGNILKLDKPIIMDKHCVGGVAGNRTTPIIVSIIAAAGLTIPKTSSRSITSPAGTADTMEVLAPVVMPLQKMRSIVKKTGGCFVWGGSLNLAPADDRIICVERPLSIDAKSQLLASVMSKKASVSATHLLIDIPYGKTAKIADIRKANQLKKDFETISHKLGIKARVIITDGSSPIGNGIGPALEAKDILYVLTNHKNAPKDLLNKSLKMAGIMLELSGTVKNGYEKAKEILDSGAAYHKFIEIVTAQGGKEIQAGKIKLGKYRHTVKCHKSGTIKSISNIAVTKIARIAGAPANKSAGVYLYKHVNHKVKLGDPLFTIYSGSKLKLKFSVDAYKRIGGIEIK